MLEMKKIKEELKNLKIQYTHQRASILAVLKSSLTPKTVEELMFELKDNVDLSTLYRSLELFEKKNIITKTELKDPLQNIYEYNRNKHKHHLICVQCREILLVEDCPLHDYERKIMEKTEYIINDHQLNLYGICPKCQAINK